MGYRGDGSHRLAGLRASSAAMPGDGLGTPGTGGSRARVRDDQGKEGGYLVAYGYPDTVLEKVAGEATGLLGFSVTLPPLRCSINGAILRSFDYEWWPTPEYADRPRLVLDTIADLLGATNNRSGP